jgi:hypothetical protein
MSGNLSPNATSLFIHKHFLSIVKFLKLPLYIGSQVGHLDILFTSLIKILNTSGAGGP